MVLTSQPADAQQPAAPTPPPQADRRQPSFIRDHFATIVVFAVFTLMLAVYVMEIHWSGNDTVVTWLQNKLSDLIAALLMGLTSAGIKTVVGGSK